MARRNGGTSERERDAVLEGIMAFLILSLIGLPTAWVMARNHANSPSQVALDRQIAIEAKRDDVAWISLRDVARRHLAAVRTGASDRPDTELDAALISYAQQGKPFWRSAGQDPTPGLVVLKEAAYALAAPKRTSCPENAKHDAEPRCMRYLEALVTVFGRDL